VGRRLTSQTLQPVTDRTLCTAHKRNTDRVFDSQTALPTLRTMGEGGGDDDEVRKSEDKDEEG
jgi:hypothetical protein